MFTYFDLHIGRITAVLEKGWIYVLGAHNTSSQLPDFCYGNASLNAEHFPTSEECFLQWYFLAFLLTGDGAPTGNYGYTNSGYSVYEEENERLTESLRTKVSAIKSVSI